MAQGYGHNCKDCLYADIQGGRFNDCKLTGNSEPIPQGALERFGADSLKRHASYFTGVCSALEAEDALENLDRDAAYGCSFYRHAEGVLSY
jgi:hypothetical protein